MPSTTSHASAATPADSSDLYPARWGRLQGATPAERAVAWAERLRGRAASNDVQRLFAALSATPEGWTHNLQAKTAGISTLTITHRDGLLYTTMRPVWGDRATCYGTTTPAAEGARAAAARAYLFALERTGVLLDLENDRGTGPWEVRLAGEVVEALTCRPPAPGLRPWRIESWRLGMARGAQSTVGLVMVGAAERCGALALVHWTGASSPVPAAPWTVAARRAATRAGLSDAHQWSIRPMPGP